jgi:hypothetical protein
VRTELDDVPSVAWRSELRQVRKVAVRHEQPRAPSAHEWVSQPDLALELQDIRSRSARHEDERNVMRHEPVDWLKRLGDGALAAIAPQEIGRAEDDKRDLR